MSHKPSWKRQFNHEDIETTKLYELDSFNDDKAPMDAYGQLDAIETEGMLLSMEAEDYLRSRAHHPAFRNRPSE